MRVALLSLVLAACSGRYEDIGLPDDWGIEPMSYVRHEVTATTCGDLEPEGYIGETMQIINHQDGPPGTDKVLFEISGFRLLSCEGVTAEGDGYAVTCETIPIIVNPDERDFIGYADHSATAVFSSSTAMRLDAVWDVNDCARESSCTPWPAPCKVEYSVFYEAD